MAELTVWVNDFNTLIVYAKQGIALVICIVIATVIWLHPSENYCQ